MHWFTEQTIARETVQHSPFPELNAILNSSTNGIRISSEPLKISVYSFQTSRLPNAVPHASFFSNLPFSKFMLLISTKHNHTDEQSI